MGSFSVMLCAVIFTFTELRCVLTVRLLCPFPSILLEGDGEFFLNWEVRQAMSLSVMAAGWCCLCLCIYHALEP